MIDNKEQQQGGQQGGQQGSQQGGQQGSQQGEVVEQQQQGQQEAEAQAVESDTPIALNIEKKSNRGVFPTWGDLLAILGLFLVTQLVTRFIFALLNIDVSLAAELDTTDEMKLRMSEFKVGYNLFLWSAIAQPMMLAFVLIYRQIRGGKLWGRVAHSMRGFDPTILLWGIVMLVCVAIVIEPVMELLPETSTTSGRGIYMLFSLLIIAPVFEELLCRGVIFEAVRAKRGAWAACVISSMIFGLMHLEPQFVLNAFIIGLLLSYIYLRTRSIFAPIILHAVNNLFAYLFLIFGVADRSLRDFVGGGVIYTIVYAAAAIILLVSLFAITRYINKLERLDREKGDAETAKINLEEEMLK